MCHGCVLRDDDDDDDDDTDNNYCRLKRLPRNGRGQAEVRPSTVSNSSKHSCGL
jgi:hypothetical protein